MPNPTKTTAVHIPPDSTRVRRISRLGCGESRALGSELTTRARPATTARHGQTAATADADVEVGQVWPERNHAVVGLFGQLANPRDDPASRSQPENSAFGMLGA
jgi:hypothetical protein